MSDSTRIEASCHCGNIQLDLDWPIADTEIGVRQCSCSFCRKHGGSWTSNRSAAVTVTVGDDAQLTKYRFGTRTADFWVCANCGIVPLVTGEIDGQLYAVVNVNTFTKAPGFRFSTSTTDFDGEGMDDRIARRKRNWIPNVVVAA